MKRITLLALMAFAISLSAVYSLEVDRDELSSATDTVDFINYSGPHDVINTIAEIRGIGSRLGNQIRQMPPSEAARVGDGRYNVIHAVDSTEAGGLEADILVLGPTVRVDHIVNLRRIISSYLSAAYGYSERDGDTIAVFITVYNAVHRGDIEFFQSKYKNVVTRELTAEGAGLSRVYSDWPGKTQIVIPLSDPMFTGTLSTIDTSALIEPEVIESIKEDEDTPQEIRTEMTELREREGDEAQDRADQAREEAEQAHEEVAQIEQEVAVAQEMVEQAREEAEQAREEATRLDREAEVVQIAAETARQEAEQAQEEATRLTREAEVAQRAAETARQDPDMSEEEVLRLDREAEMAQRAAETARQDANGALTIVMEHESEAARLAAESEAARAAADARDSEAEALEREVAALREQQEEAARRAAAAEGRAEREQELADARQEETAQERREIAADTQEHLDRSAEMRDAAIAEARTNAALRVVNADGFLSEIILVNTANGAPMRTSALSSVRNRTLIDTGDAFMAVAGQGPAVHLVLIDKITLDVIKESEQPVAPQSVLVSEGNSYYAVVSRGGAFYVARFDKDLNVQSMSSVQVQPYTAITISEGRLFVQDTTSRVRILRSTDLIDTAPAGLDSGIIR